MAWIRRHLRRGVVAWLVCHAITFTALVPRDCCATHAHADVPPCHEMAAEVAAAPGMGDHCDMPSSDGAAYPMHRAGAPAAGCAMTGVCHAPEAALASVLWQAAVAPAPLQLVTPAAVRAPRAAPVTPSLALTVPPDSPPPRS